MRVCRMKTPFSNFSGEGWMGQKQTTKATSTATTTTTSTMAVHVRYNSWYISLPFSTNRTMFCMQYSRERELGRKISFSNVDAVLHIQFGIVLTVMDELNELKLLRDSKEYKVIF